MYQCSQCPDVLDALNTETTNVFVYVLYVHVFFKAIHSLEQKYISIYYT